MYLKSFNAKALNCKCFKDTKIHYSKFKDPFVINLKLVPKCEVQLLKNIWVESGLTNGAIGTFYGALWRTGNKCNDKPDVLMIHFPKYTGPQQYVLKSDSKIHLVPIYRMSTYMKNGSGLDLNVNCKSKS